MIDAILIINDFGLLEFYWKSQDVDWEENLVTGLINALNFFTTKILEDDLLLNVRFKEKQIILTKDNERKLLFALITKHILPLEIADACLSEIRYKMDKYFPIDSSSDLVIGNKVTDSFTKMVKVIITSWKVKIKRKMQKKSQEKEKSFSAFEEVKDREELSYIVS